jgi:hypothetical protein
MTGGARWRWRTAAVLWRLGHNHEMPMAAGVPAALCIRLRRSTALRPWWAGDSTTLPPHGAAATMARLRQLGTRARFQPWRAMDSSALPPPRATALTAT